MINNIKYSAGEIAKIIDGVLEGEDIYINSISLDSREISKFPSCFFAIKGKNFNGVNYIEEAISNGAGLIVTQEKIECSKSVIYVENTIKALGLFAKYHKGKTTVIGITGSYGKTTVKDMVFSVLKEKYSVCGTESNMNNEIGVSMTLLGIENHDFCVVEMGMRALGEIDWLAYISEPDTSIIVNCGTAHIGRLGCKENIFKAKTEIIKHTKKCVICPDNEEFLKLDCKDIQKVAVGEFGEYFAYDVEAFENAIKFKITGNEFEIRSSYLHNVNNAVFAYVVGTYYGLNYEEIKRGLYKWEQRENRGKTIDIKGIKVINDSYNASYESVKGAIISICSAKNKGVVSVLLGDMLELGEYSKELHFLVGKMCREMGVSNLYAIGKNAEFYVEGFGGGYIFENADDASEKILKMLSPGDTLLIKASNAMNFEKIINIMREK